MGWGGGRWSAIKWKHGPMWYLLLTVKLETQAPYHDFLARVIFGENQSHMFEWHLLSSCFQIQTELTRGIHDFNLGADFT